MENHEEAIVANPDARRQGEVVEQPTPDSQSESLADTRADSEQLAKDIKKDHDDAERKAQEFLAQINGGMAEAASAKSEAEAVSMPVAQESGPIGQAVADFDVAKKMKEGAGTYEAQKAYGAAYEKLKQVIRDAKAAGAPVDREVVDRVSSVKLGSGFGVPESQAAPENVGSEQSPELQPQVSETRPEITAAAFEAPREERQPSEMEQLGTLEERRAAFFQKGIEKLQLGDWDGLRNVLYGIAGPDGNVKMRDSGNAWSVGELVKALKDPENGSTVAAEDFQLLEAYKKVAGEASAAHVGEQSVEVAESQPEEETIVGQPEETVVADQTSEISQEATPREPEQPEESLPAEVATETVPVAAEGELKMTREQYTAAVRAAKTQEDIAVAFEKYADGAEKVLINDFEISTVRHAQNIRDGKLTGMKDPEALVRLKELREAGLLQVRQEGADVKASEPPEAGAKTLEPQTEQLESESEQPEELQEVAELEEQTNENAPESAEETLEYVSEAGENFAEGTREWFNQRLEQARSLEDVAQAVLDMKDKDGLFTLHMVGKSRMRVSAEDLAENVLGKYGDSISDLDIQDAIRRINNGNGSGIEDISEKDNTENLETTMEKQEETPEVTPETHPETPPPSVPSPRREDGPGNVSRTSKVVAAALAGTILTGDSQMQAYRDAAEVGNLTKASGEVTDTQIKQGEVEQVAHDLSEPFHLDGTPESIPELRDQVSEQTRILTESLLNDPADAENSAYRLAAAREMIAKYGAEKWVKLVDVLGNASPGSEAEKALTPEQITQNRLMARMTEIASGGSYGGSIEQVNEKLYALADVLEAGNFDTIKSVYGQLRELGYNKTLEIRMMTPKWMEILSDPNEQKAFVFMSKTLRPGMVQQMLPAGMTRDQFYELRPTQQQKMFIQSQIDRK